MTNGNQTSRRQPRWRSRSRPGVDFEKRVKQLCSNCQVVYENANGDAAQQQSEGDAVLAQRVKVLVLDAVDAGSAGSIVAKANAAHIPVVSYDRLITNADIDYYVSFDNTRVGRLQGQSLAAKLKSAIYGANDDLAGGGITAMKSAGIKPSTRPTTGQDATVAGIGDQCMTVYKAVTKEAHVAAEIAVPLAKGQKPPAGLPTSNQNNGKKNVPSALLTPVAVTKSNVKSTVVKDGYDTAAQICTAAFKAACAPAGIH